jgi:iron(III) transport system substrate-binding protein
LPGFAGALVALALLSSGCTLRKETWIYASLPKDVVVEMAEPLEAAIPDADIRWYQSSIENIEARIASELASGKVKADIVLTGDPLWFEEMKKKGRLLAYESPAVKEMPAWLKDPDGAFATLRVSAMVMAFNAAALGKQPELPEKWKDLESPKFDRKVSMASPFDSASTLMTVTLLSRDYGWDYFAGLRKLGLVSEGSQSSALTRVETGERPIGILPLETVLRADRGGGTGAGIGEAKPQLKVIYPQDGAILVPGPIAILADSEHATLAKRVYDWFFGPQAQGALVRGGTYSPVPKQPSPEGARPWAEISQHALKWEPSTLEQLLAGRDKVKAKFSEAVLH